ncbi:sensor histidine kinase [Roseivirga seohaensis]|uniref:sensor histidine kinase n=1 Tax=Roseivirga seohaensis TaxID=1914963 RepID=UPI003BA8D21B
MFRIVVFISILSLFYYEGIAQFGDGSEIAKLYHELDSVRKIKDIDSEFSILTTLIYSLSNDGKRERAQELGERALELLPLIEDSFAKKNLYDALGVASSNAESRYGARDEAVSYYYRGLEITTNKPVDDFWLYFGIGRTYWFKTRSDVYLGQPYRSSYDSSLHYFNLAKSVADSTISYSSILDLLTWEGRLSFFSEDKEDIKTAYLESKKYLKDTAEMSMTSKIMLLDMLYAATLRYNEMDSTLELRRAISHYNQILRKEEREELINELDRKYELDIKESELDQTINQLSARNRTVILVALLFLFSSAIAFYLRNLLQKNKRLAQRNELLVREQNHRVKNNLQMISSLLSLQAGKAQDEVSKDALKQSQGRIQAIALLNRSLYDQEEIGDIDLKIYISELITEVINSITDTEVKYQLDIDNIKLNLEKTTSLGLIINELIVNSVKYVKQSVTEFSLSIKAQSGKFSLEYADNGESFDLQAYQNSKSFGKKLVELQAKQLRGQSKVSEDSQFRFNLNFV